MNAFFNKLQYYLSNIGLIKNRIIIRDNFNIDITLTNQDQISNSFLNMLDSFGLKINFTDPTRITDTTKTRIDYILRNCYVQYSLIINPQISDHMVVLIAIQTS